MSLGWPEFEEAGRSLAALSLRCGDGWQWVEQREGYAGGMLVHESHVVHGNIYHVHIVYSPTYSCPVLYFNGRKPDGQLLSLAQIWDTLRNHVSGGEAKSEEELWKTATQADHPLLGRPFYMLHPCETVSFMREMFETETDPEPVRYLLSWLSVLGAPLALDIRPLRSLFLAKKI